jgi:hypothetical protein
VEIIWFIIIGTGSVGNVQHRTNKKSSKAKIRWKKFAFISRLLPSTDIADPAV